MGTLRLAQQVTVTILSLHTTEYANLKLDLEVTVEKASHIILHILHITSILHIIFNDILHIFLHIQVLHMEKGNVQCGFCTQSIS